MGRSITTRRGPLPTPRVCAKETNLTQFSGAVPLLRFLAGILSLPQQLARVVSDTGRSRTFAVHLVLYAFLVGALLGVERLAHLEWLKGDAVLLKFLRLPRWPVRKVFSNALGSLSNKAIARLTTLLSQLGLRPVIGALCAVVDVDSSAVVSFGLQEGALFGYSGKGRNRRRHHPLVASVAASRTVVHAKYRDGSAIAHEEALAFIQAALAKVQAVLAQGGRVILRADSGFWSKPLALALLADNVPFVFAMPLQPGLKLLLRAARWQPLDGDADIETVVIPGQHLNLDPRLRIIGIRRRIHDEKAPPQGKEIAGCTQWRYQALVAHLDGSAEAIWRFYNDRGDCERIFKVGRGALGMGWLVGRPFRANETAFLLRMLAFNVDMLFQRHCEERAREEKRPVLRLGLMARQHRFYNGVGRLLRVQDRWQLNVRKNVMVEQLWSFYAPDLLQRE